MSRQKRIIQADSEEQIIDFVSTYKYWSINDGSDILFTNENNDIAKALTEAIDIGVKRGKQFLIVRVGASEANSRTNDEMFIELNKFTSGTQQFQQFQPQNNNNNILYGFQTRTPQTLNNTGITAQELQTYLNGALDRQQQNFEQSNKAQILEVQSEFKKQMLEQELQLKMKLFEQQMEFMRSNMEREQRELERKRQELEDYEDELLEEKKQRTTGLNGLLGTILDFGKDYLGDDDDKPETNNDKDATLSGKSGNENFKGFEDVDGPETETETETEIDILNGFDKLSEDNLALLELLIKEKKEQTQHNNTDNEV